MLNTDQHNVQVKNKMSEEDFVRNNREISDGDYHSICKNEIRTMPVEERTEFAEMTPGKWIDLMNKSKKTAKYIVPDSRSSLDRDMFSTMPGPTISAISAVYSLAGDEEVCQKCIDGFLAVAKVSSCHHLEGVLDDVVVYVSRFTTLLNHHLYTVGEYTVRAFIDNGKAQMATLALFTIANKYRDFIRDGWRNVVGLSWLLGGLRSGLATYMRMKTLLFFCLELLFSITLINIERIGIMWGGVYKRMANVVESNATPCGLIEKAAFGLLRICQMILHHEEDKAKKLLKLLQESKKGNQNCSE